MEILSHLRASSPSSFTFVFSPSEIPSSPTPSPSFPCLWTHLLSHIGTSGITDSHMSLQEFNAASALFVGWKVIPTSRRASHPPRLGWPHRRVLFFVFLFFLFFFISLFFCVFHLFFCVCSFSFYFVLLVFSCFSVFSPFGGLFFFLFFLFLFCSSSFSYCLFFFCLFFHFSSSLFNFFLLFHTSCTRHVCCHTRYSESGSRRHRLCRSAETPWTHPP